MLTIPPNNLFWSIAGPLTLGLLACGELTRFRNLTSRLSAFVLAAPFFMNLMLAGVNVQATAGYFVSAIAATLVLLVAVRRYLDRKCGYTSLYLGFCAFVVAAYAAFEGSLKIHPAIWTLAIVLGAVAAKDHILTPFDTKPAPDMPKEIDWKAVGARMTIALIYINGVVAFKGMLGAQQSSALVAFPSIFFLTSILALRDGGKAELARYLSRYVLGIPSCAVFGLVLTQLPTCGAAVAAAAGAATLTLFLTDELVKKG